MALRAPRNGGRMGKVASTGTRARRGEPGTAWQTPLVVRGVRPGQPTTAPRRPSDFGSVRPKRGFWYPTQRVPWQYATRPRYHEPILSLSSRYLGCRTISKRADRAPASLLTPYGAFAWWSALAAGHQACPPARATTPGQSACVGKGMPGSMLRALPITRLSFPYLLAILAAGARRDAGTECYAPLLTSYGTRSDCPIRRLRMRPRMPPGALPTWDWGARRPRALLLRRRHWLGR